MFTEILYDPIEVCYYSFMSTNTNNSKNKCQYCGDAFVSHELTYFSCFLGMLLDPSMYFVVDKAPNFLKRFVDWFLGFIFDCLVFFGFATLSSDIEKAKSLRSKVVWQEAKRRGLVVKQLVVMGKPTEAYKVWIRGKGHYFNSLPIPPKMLDNKENWDDKFILKKYLEKAGVPVPKYYETSMFSFVSPKKIFEKFTKPIIVKPRIGSRGRHTTTNINTLEEFKQALDCARQVCPTISIEEHLHGYICRATLVNGKLLGFYRAEPPSVIGDGIKTIRELIEDKDQNRRERVSAVTLTQEVLEYLGRYGYTLESVPPRGIRVELTHRTGRLFGGATREMHKEVHPSFRPILERAAKTTGLAVVGFDVIVPDPEKAESSQRWGIIEANTLPFIDLHYFALEGEAPNVAGAVWDLWNK